MQEFNITIVDKPGRENLVVDFLSHLQTPDDPASIEDNFPDEHLFLLLAQNPWYADIANYLTTGETPPHFSAKEKRLLAEKNLTSHGSQGLCFILD